MNKFYLNQEIIDKDLCENETSINSSRCSTQPSSPEFNESRHIEPINFIRLGSDEKFLSKIRIEKNRNNRENLHRENWTGKADFFMATLAYAVGLGAVWRFPYLCYKNGGGVFLIPYFFFLIVIGIPLVFLELSVGQYTSTGPLTCWRMTPIFRGIGISMNLVNGYLCVYYNMILAYSIYYLYYTFSSLQSMELPWQSCNPKCALTVLNKTASCDLAKSDLITLGIWKPTFPSQDFWSKIILEKTDSIDNTGEIVWQLVIALFISWVIVFMLVVNGIQVSGKLVYFTALFPYVVLLILGIRGWFLEGASYGIKYYIYPDFTRLLDYSIWTDAAVQIFFTLNVAYGGLITLSSYNTYNTNILRDAILVSISNCLTSVFAGFVIFAYLGHLAFVSNQDINNIVEAGQGLAYVIYPFAVTTIKGSSFWAILFFFMMLVLGLDTMMASVETLITSIFDAAPALKKNNFRRVISIICICTVLYLSGLIFCTQSGTYWVEVLDKYSGNWGILIVAALECISVTWFYGFKEFRIEISTMIGKQITNSPLFNIWNIFWSFLSPGVLIIVVALTLIGPQKLEINGYVYPDWTIVVGNIITMTTLSGVFLWAIYAIFNILFINKRPLKTLFVADDKWRPLKYEDYMMVRDAKDELMRREKRPFKYIDGTINQNFDNTVSMRF